MILMLEPPMPEQRLIEIDHGTLLKAEKRIAEHIRQVELFEPATAYPGLFDGE